VLKEYTSFFIIKVPFLEMKQWPAIRNVLLFLGGLAGVVHETLLASSERPTLLILFAAMLGLPAFLKSPEDKSPSQVVVYEQPPKEISKETSE
jgi:hypothetical protein